MAYSPGPADSRAHLIRELARSSERSYSRGSASSAGSAREQQAAYDTATQELPLPSENDFHINSSALRRAFPDFSQYGSSEEDSIEVGRGIKGSIRGTTARSLRSADVSENLSFSFGAGSRYEITATPPMKPRDKQHRQTSILKPSARASSMKENVDPLGKTTNFVGKNDTDRKVLGQNMHARVESDDTASLNDKRPDAVIATSRNTRFDRRSRHISNNGYALSEATGTMEVNENVAGLTKADQAAYNGTIEQSFLLPDLPNMTELISGKREDGTPTWNRSAKAAARFGTPGSRRKPSALKQTHLPISSVPIPIDEKALYVSLQMLQEKVAGLEADKAKIEGQLEEYELENLQLKSKLEEQEQRRYSDSALGTDVEDAKRKDWEGQKTQLESSIRNLQDRLDRANRKLTTSEVTIATMTNDRDAAHKSLAVAYLNSEELKNESDIMQKEVADVQKEFAKEMKKHEARIAKLTNQESELRGKIERREKAVKEMSSLAKQLWDTRNALAASRTNMESNGENQYTGVAESTAPVNIVPSRATSVRMPSTNRHRGAQRERSQSRGRQSELARQETELIDATTDININVPQQHRNIDLDIDSTYLSFMDGDEVSKLRRIVEEDKALLAEANGQDYVDQTQHSVCNEFTNKTNPVPRKSSMKSVSYKLDDATKQSIRTEATGHVRENAMIQDEDPVDEDEVSQTGISLENKQDTQRSIASLRNQRRAQDVTSAFIIPDITMHGIAAITPSGSSNATSKKTATITRPVPVSDRMPSAIPGQDEPTVRPGQSPGLALATVLRGLESELQTLRQQLAEQENLYNQHDPSLSKRQRKIVYARIHKLLAMIETRADQIYALYDVLEGQKDKGQMMQEEEVEVTLQNIGIDFDAARPMTSRTFKAGNEESDGEIDEEDMEPQWEGFEATNTQELPSLRGIKVR